jgi:hypothetical protein
MLARRLRRFLRLLQEKPLTLSLIPPPRRIGGLPSFLGAMRVWIQALLLKRRHRQSFDVSCLEKAYLSGFLRVRPDMRGR